MKVTLSFHVECSKTRPGEAVFICGSLPELGAWKPTEAVPCVTAAQVFPNWSSETVALLDGTSAAEFKLLTMGADGSGKARWEGGGNRSVHFHRASSTSSQVHYTVSCGWGTQNVSIKTQFSPDGSAKPEEVTTAEDDGDEGERNDSMSELHKFPDKRPSGTSGGFGAHLAPLSSSNLTAGPLTRVMSGELPAGMVRQCSRHLVVHSDGMLNPDMSRTPSMMLIDYDQLDRDAAAQESKVEELEAAQRNKLNEMQMRVPSGTLLEGIREITNFADRSKTVLLQGFNWESWRAGQGNWYGMVESKVPMLAEMGITDVWLPPPSQSVAPQGYLPSQLFNLDDSKYGNQEALERLVKALHEEGIRAVADIVINHRCGDKQDSQGRWNQFSTGMTKRASFAGVMDWGGWAVTLGTQYSDGTGQHHPACFDASFDAAPDIDHANEKVQRSIAIWLRWLRLQIGFDAWRFDFVKGYAARYVGLYCKKSEPAWAVGELWEDMSYDEGGLIHDQDKSRQNIINWINATDKQCTAFDFTTKGILQEAVRNTEYWRLKDQQGKPPGVLGWMPSHAVTFIDNHDTGSTQRHWPFPDDKVLVGYAYILTHPGIPSIFWDHVMDWGEDHRRKITDLLKARNDSGISVDAPVNIQCADRDLYIAEVGKPPALRVALGPRHAGDPDGNYWKQGPRGHGWRVWVHPEEPTPAPAAPQHQEPKAEQPKSAAKPAFKSVTVDGLFVTPTGLEGMGTPELEDLCGKVRPMLDAAEGALKARKP